MRRGFLLATALFASVLAGCGAAPDVGPAPSMTSGEGPGSVEDPFAAPAAWEPGDWWRYDFTSSGAGGGSSTFLVTASQGPHYIVDTDNQQTAAFEAETDISYVGPIRKDNLAGQQRGADVEYFRWPLVQGARWVAQWDGVSREIKALGPQGGQFELEAQENGSAVVRYSYDPVSGFFGHLDFLTPDGSVAFAGRLAAHGSNYTGGYVRAEMENLLTFDVKDQPVGNELENFTVAQDTDTLVIEYRVECGAAAGAWDIGVAPFGAPDNQSQAFAARGGCPIQQEDTFTVTNPFVGLWGYKGQYALVVGPNHHFIEILAFKFNGFQFP